jgi:TolA-binding protein
MKKFVIAAMLAACVALCAAVWPHGNAVEETPVPAAETAVSARKATVVEITEKNSASLTEMENEISQQEASQEERPEPETESIETPADSELQPSAELSPTKNSAPEPTPSQPPKELQPGEKVYVAGFGWVEYEGPNYCEDGTDIYENGNKIGITG